MRRLINSGPDRIEIYPEVDATDSDGNPTKVPADTPIVIDAYMQPISAREASDLGLALSTTYHFNHSNFPAGPYAKIHAKGIDWDVVGEPGRRGRTRRTAYRRVYVKARGPIKEA